MERLQKVIAHAGVCSRRKAEELILSNRVKVNNKVVNTLGVKVTRNDEIKVDNRIIEKENKVYFAFNKPRSIISSVSDEHNRDTINDFFTEIEERVYPVGRLDYDTSGIILMTNDGDFTNKLIHPSSNVEKEYLVRVKGLISKETLKQLSKGVVIDDYKTKRAKTFLESYDSKNQSSLVKIIITEGKYHQVKKMFEVVEHPVKNLTRIRFGCIKIDDLPKGKFRQLKIHEVKTLLNLCKGD